MVGLLLKQGWTPAAVVALLATGANAINPDPTAIFRRNANTMILPCSGDPDEAMTPGCVLRRGRRVPIVVFLDEFAIPGGMTTLSMYPQDHIHSMDWISTPTRGELRVYTRDFIRRLDDTEMSLSPLVW